MLVFVYGTLMSDGSNNSLLELSEFVGETTAPLLMFDLGPFPGCVHGPGTVYGEVYRIDEYTLYTLDILEGCPDLYTRDLIDTEYGPAYVYIINRDLTHADFVKGGRWTNVKFAKVEDVQL